MVKIKPLLLFMIILLVVPTGVVLADIGPKPSMDFEFVERGELTIVSGILYECDQPDCSDAAPLEELGPQGLRCDAISCSAIGYGFAPYHILEIEFSDGTTRRSNIFETGGFDSVYQVTVQPGDLLVELEYATAAPTDELFQPQSNGDGFPRIAVIILACVCVAIAGLALIGLVIFIIRRSAKK